MRAIRQVPAEELLGHADWVRRIARDLVAEAELDDVSQDAWVKYVRHPPRLPDRARAWLRVVVRNLIHTRRRAERRRLSREALVGATRPTTASPEDLVAQAEVQGRLIERISALKDRHREAIRLRYVEGLSAAEISRVLKVPAGTVRRRLKEALDQLRDELDAADGRGERWRFALAPLVGGGARPRRPSGLAAWAALTTSLALVTSGLIWVATRHHEPMAGSPPPVSRPRAGGFLAPRADEPAQAQPSTAAIEGTVRGPTGEPVVGARLLVLDRSDRDRIIGSASTGAGGQYRLVDVPGGHLAIHATAGTAWAGRELGRLPAGRASRVDLKLQDRESTLEGLVWDSASGLGVAHAKVRAVTYNPSGRAQSSDLFIDVQADERGRYKLSAPEGRYQIRAAADGYADSSAYLQIVGSDGLDLALHRLGEIAGRVVESATGRPVAGATVAVLVRDAGRAPFVLSAPVDPSGAFRLAVAAGSYHVWSENGVQVGTSPVVAVQPGETATTEVRVSRAAVVRGRVLSHDGRALAGVSVSGTMLGAREYRGLRAWATSAPDGSYELRGLPPGDLRVSASGEGYVPTSLERRAGALEQQRIDLVLAPEAMVRGRVLGPLGEPSPDARVYARIQARAATSVRYHEVSTDEDGRFELRGMPASDVWLTVRGRDGAGTSSGPQPLGAGEVRDMELTLAPAAWISGRVVFPDGAPAPGIRVEALADNDDTEPSISALAAADGSFTVGPLGAGPISLQLGWNGFHSKRDRPNPPELRASETRVAAGEHKRGIVLTVPRHPGKLVGLVTDRQGRPISGATVEVYLATRPARFRAGVVFTDQRGGFEVRELLPGAHALRAWHPALGEAEAETQTGDEEIVLRLPRSSPARP